MLRLLTRPRWLLRHLIVIGLCVAFVFLGRWQLHRGEARQGTIQNYGYAIEWPLFGVAVVFAWCKMLQDELHPHGNDGKTGKVQRVSPWKTPGTTAKAPAPDRGGFPKPLTTADIDPDDIEVVRYNEWLARFTESPVDGYRARAHR